MMIWDEGGLKMRDFLVSCLFRKKSKLLKIIIKITQNHLKSLKNH